jgi:hypothetical protein
MAVEVSCIPEGTNEVPQQVDQLTDPEVPCEVSAIHDESEKKSLLYLGPLA